MPIKEMLLSTGSSIVKDGEGGVEAIKSSGKINCSVIAGHSSQGIINISLV